VKRDEAGRLSLNAKAMGLLVGSNSLGGLAGRLLGGALTDHFGWRVAMAVKARRGRQAQPEREGGGEGEQADHRHGDAPAEMVGESAISAMPACRGCSPRRSC
jgi:hypothetical protein